MNSSNRTLTAIKDIEGGLFRKNYISNDGANFTTTGWATYADAAGTRPVDGTGGSPSITWTRTSSSPLSNDASFLFTKDAANRQGQGVSYDFTIDDADKQKLMTIEFDYQIASGTFVGSQSIATNSDLIVYLYDVTASTLIEPTPFLLDGTSSTSYFYRYRGSFQTSSSSQYRLIIHTATTSASAYTVKFDNFKVCAGEYVKGAIMTDWSSYTPTFSNFGSVTNNTISYRRVGDTLEILGSFQCGTNSAASGSFTIPSGLTIDTTKAYRAASVNGVGHWTSTNSGTQAISSSDREGLLFLDGSSTNTIYFAGSNGTSSNLFQKENASNITNSNGVITVQLNVPILGWSSGMTLASDGDNRLVAAKAYKSSTTSVTANTAIVFDTKEYDTHNAYNNSTGVFTCPSSGYYSIDVGVQANAIGGIYIYKNGSNFSYITATNSGSNAGAGATKISLNAGDTVAIYSDTTMNVNGSAQVITRVAFTKIMGNLMASPNDPVAVRYNSTSDTWANSATVYKYTVKDFDTHNAYSTSTGLFTAPVSGYYTISAAASTPGITASTTDAIIILVYKNGVNIANNGVLGNGATNVGYTVTIASNVKLNAGDTLGVYAFRLLSTAGNSSSTAGNFISINKVG